MKFDLRRPCQQCPFRSDIAGYLSPARAREIIRAITTEQRTFSCHKTVRYSDDESDDETGTREHVASNDEQHCAGAAIFLERQNRPNQMMRIAERLRLYDSSKLDMSAPVFATAALMIAAQRSRRKKR